MDTYTSKINRTRANKTRVIKVSENTDEDEGLSTLIPDIQNTTGIVQTATARLIGNTDNSAGTSTQQPEIPIKSLEERYLDVMRKLQFGQWFFL